MRPCQQLGHHLESSVRQPTWRSGRTSLACYPHSTLVIVHVKRKIDKIWKSFPETPQLLCGSLTHAEPNLTSDTCLQSNRVRRPPRCLKTDVRYSLRSAGRSIRLFEFPLVPFRQAHVATGFRVLPVRESLGIMGRTLASGAASTVYEARGLLEKVVFAAKTVESRIFVLWLQFA